MLKPQISEVYLKGDPQQVNLNIAFYLAIQPKLPIDFTVYKIYICLYDGELIYIHFSDNLKRSLISNQCDRAIDIVNTLLS